MSKRKAVAEKWPKVFGWMKRAATIIYIWFAGIVALTILFSMFHTGENISCPGISFFNLIAVGYRCEWAKSVSPIVRDPVAQWFDVP